MAGSDGRRPEGLGFCASINEPAVAYKGEVPSIICWYGFMQDEGVPDYEIYPYNRTRRSRLGWMRGAESVKKTAK